MKVVLIRTQPEKACPTKNVVFMRVSGFVVLTQSYHRLPRESMVRKFALMFLNDDSYPKLEQSLKEGNAQEAFRAAHTLKGVCQNLGFTNLYQPAYELTEVLRAGTLEGSGEWFARVTEQYKITTDAIRGVQ